MKKVFNTLLILSFLWGGASCSDDDNEPIDDGGKVDPPVLEARAPYKTNTIDAQVMYWQSISGEKYKLMQVDKDGNHTAVSVTHQGKEYKEILGDSGQEGSLYSYAINKKTSILGFRSSTLNFDSPEVHRITQHTFIVNHEDGEMYATTAMRPVDFNTTYYTLVTAGKKVEREFLPISLDSKDTYEFNRVISEGVYTRLEPIVKVPRKYKNTETRLDQHLVLKDDALCMIYRNSTENYPNATLYPIIYSKSGSSKEVIIEDFIAEISSKVGKDANNLKINFGRIFTDKNKDLYFAIRVTEKDNDKFKQAMGYALYQIERKENNIVKTYLGFTEGPDFIQHYPIESETKYPIVTDINESKFMMFNITDKSLTTLSVLPGLPNNIDAIESTDDYFICDNEELNRMEIWTNGYNFHKTLQENSAFKELIIYKKDIDVVGNRILAQDYRLVDLEDGTLSNLGLTEEHHPVLVK